MFRKKTKKQEPRRDEKSTLAAILLSMKAITPEQLEKARTLREEHETSHADMLLASTLRSMGFCTSDDVGAALKIQSKMLEGDRASVALDLMEARLERYRVGEEQLRQEVEKRRDTLVIIPFSPVTAKAM